MADNGTSNSPESPAKILAGAADANTAPSPVKLEGSFEGLLDLPEYKEVAKAFLNVLEANEKLEYSAKVTGEDDGTSTLSIPIPHKALPEQGVIPVIYSRKSAIPIACQRVKFRVANMAVDAGQSSQEQNPKDDEPPQDPLPTIKFEGSKQTVFDRQEHKAFGEALYNLLHSNNDNHPQGLALFVGDSALPLPMKISHFPQECLMSVAYHKGTVIPLFYKSAIIQSTISDDN